MTDTRALYEKVILDHNKNPRNFGELPGATQKAEGYNPLCGDQVTVFLKLNGDVIEDIHFAGAGCAISKSAASIMTTAIKGKTKTEAQALFDAFHRMITSDPGAPVDEAKLGKLAVFSGVREYPVRIKCATLAWHTFLAALRDAKGPVTTE